MDENGGEFVSKVLVVSAVPSHPARGGEGVHALVLADCLLELGHEAHFLLVPRGATANDAMRAHWGGRLHLLQERAPEATSEREAAVRASNGRRPGNVPFRGYYRRLRRMAGRFLRYVLGQRRVIPWGPELDAWYDGAIDDELRRLQRQHRFGAVVAGSVSVSRALAAFSSSVVKVLDGHDALAGRYGRMFRSGRWPVACLGSSPGSVRCLDRADVVLANEPRAGEYLASLTSSRVLVTETTRNPRMASDELRDLLERAARERAGIPHPVVVLATDSDFWYEDHGTRVRVGALCRYLERTCGALHVFYTRNVKAPDKAALAERFPTLHVHACPPPADSARVARLPELSLIHI